MRGFLLGANAWEELVSMAGVEGVEHSAHRGFRRAIKVIMEHLTIWESLKTSAGISEADLYKEDNRMY